MAKDLRNTLWHGIARQEIDWHPKVEAAACIGCELCYVTCGRDVYEITMADGKHRKAEVARPFNCMVGCSTCSVVCPTEAIHFPPRDVVWEAERQHKIFKKVRSEAEAKRAKSEPQAEAAAPETSAATRAKVRVAGSLGDKRLLLRLQELLDGRPYDITDLDFHVPTLAGLRDGAPGYVEMEVTSTRQESVAAFVEEVRELIEQQGLQWIPDEAEWNAAPK